MFEFLKRDGDGIARRFVALLPPGIRHNAAIADELARYVAGYDKTSMRAAIRAAFEAELEDRTAQLKMQDDIDAERKRLQRLSPPPPTDLAERLDALKDERAQISRAIRALINDVDVLRFLTDRGLLPNYAFPEEGVKLRSIIVRRPEAGGKASLVADEYSAPHRARSVSSPLARRSTPTAAASRSRGSTSARATSPTGAFCPLCMHNGPDTGLADKCCPRCGAEGWSDTGAKAAIVHMRTVASVTEEHWAAIRDLAQHHHVPAYDSGAIRIAMSAAAGPGVPPLASTSSSAASSVRSTSAASRRWRTDS